MDELFRMEAESQTQLLTTSLLALERDPKAEEHLEACMRAAHSLKGAARLVGVAAAADITHAMEDCFVGAQRGEIVLNGRQIDFLLDGVADKRNAIYFQSRTPLASHCVSVN